MIFALGKWCELGMKFVRKTQIIIKRGYIIGFDDCGYPIVDMIDPFNTGATKVNWCPPRFWEPCPVKLTCKSLL